MHIDEELETLTKDTIKIIFNDIINKINDIEDGNDESKFVYAIIGVKIADIKELTA